MSTNITNITILDIFPPEIASNIQPLILILKTVGIIAIIYFIVMTVSLILNIYRTRLITKTYKKVLELENKIDKISKKSKK